MNEKTVFSCVEDISKWYKCPYCHIKSDLIFHRGHFRKFHAQKNPLTSFCADHYLCGNCNYTSYSFLRCLKHNLTCKQNDPENSLKLDNKLSLFYYNHYKYMSDYKQFVKREILAKQDLNENVPKYDCNTCNF